jgi:hypothetical protein
MAIDLSHEILEQLQQLPHEEQLRLLSVLKARVAGHPDSDAARSVLELEGLGAELWNGIDAQEYVSRERASWNG